MGRVINTKRTLLLAGALLFLLFCALSFFVPFPKEVQLKQRTYRCVWESGEVTEESESAAFCSFSSAGEEILLSRNGKRGTVIPGESYTHAYHVLKNGTLLELLNLNVSLTRLERLGLIRVFGDSIFYSAGGFIFHGEGVCPTARTNADEVVLLNGTLPKDYLKKSHATALVLRAEAEPDAGMLTGSNVQTIVAALPYQFERGALYKNTAGGRRLIALLPSVKSAELAYDFIDEGALAPCREIEELILPFVGTSREEGTETVTEFAVIFPKEEGKYCAYPSLKKVKITGGVLRANAFYGCSSIEVLDVSGVTEIEEGAFYHLPSLKELIVGQETELEGAVLIKNEGGLFYYRFQEREMV